MKHQKVSVDVWAMLQSMGGYLAVVVLGGVLLRLLVAVVSLPSRLNKQRQDVQQAMLKLQEKYPEAFKDELADSSAEKEDSGEVQEEGQGEEEERGRDGEGDQPPTIEPKKTK